MNNRTENQKANTNSNGGMTYVSSHYILFPITKCSVWYYDCCLVKLELSIVIHYWLVPACGCVNCNFNKSLICQLRFHFFLDFAEGSHRHLHSIVSDCHHSRGRSLILQKFEIIFPTRSKIRPHNPLQHP